MIGVSVKKMRRCRFSDRYVLEFIGSILDVRRDVRRDVASVDSRDERNWGFRRKVDVMEERRKGLRTYRWGRWWV